MLLLPIEAPSSTWVRSVAAVASLARPDGSVASIGDSDDGCFCEGDNGRAPGALDDAWPLLRRAARLGDGWLGSGQTPDEAVEIAETLTRMRVEAGRENEAFEMVAPLVSPPDPATLRRLEDHGIAGTVSYPFFYSLGPTSTLALKRAVMEGFANEVIAKAS